MPECGGGGCLIFENLKNKDILSVFQKLSGFQLLFDELSHAKASVLYLQP